MRLFPNNREEWLAVALFPFKVYIVLSIPFAFFFRASINEIFSDFILCLPPLMLGAIVQLFVSDRWTSLRTFAFVAVPLFFIFLGSL